MCVRAVESRFRRVRMETSRSDCFHCTPAERADTSARHRQATPHQQVGLLGKYCRSSPLALSSVARCQVSAGAEEAGDAGGDLDLSPVPHLHALVTGQRATQLLGQVLIFAARAGATCQALIPRAEAPTSCIRWSVRPGCRARSDCPCPMMRSPSQCPARHCTALHGRSSASAGRSLT
jgi:hypothetical protein